MRSLAASPVLLAGRASHLEEVSEICEQFSDEKRDALLYDCLMIYL